jgi:large subunit ribosomal protein L22
MEARAVTRFVVISPRKAKLTADLIKGRPVNEAIAVLRFLPRRAAEHIIKTLQSAVANAIDKEGSGKLDADELFVKNAVIDPGPIMPRWRPRAYGRASRVRKRMSHIKVTVSTDVPREFKESRRGRNVEAPKKKRSTKKKGKKKDKKKK